MGFLRFFLVFLVVTLLNAGYDFSDFDARFNSSTKIEKQVFHKELKQIYINNLNSRDKDQKIQTLERLIHSSKSLGLNYQGYENELKSLGGNYSDYLNQTKPIKEDIRQSKQNDETIVVDTLPPQAEILDFSSKPMDSRTDKKVDQKIIKDEIEEIKDEDIDTSKKLNLMSVDKIDGGISLNFNRPLAINEMKQFIIDDKTYRNVIDFKAENYASTSRINDYGVDEIRIAQYKPQILRVVFSNSDKFSIDTKNSGKSLIITSRNFDKVVTQTKSTTTQEAIQKTTQKAKTKSPAVIPKVIVDEPKEIALNNKSLKKQKVIVIDPGHGGKDPGATSAGLKEKDIVLNIAKDLGQRLSKSGYKILYTRSTDNFINLKSRTAFANKKDADLFISIHINAGPNKSSKLSGIETFFLSPARSERSKNAAALENQGDIEDMNYFSQQTYLNFLNREKIIASNKLAIDIQKHMLNQVQKKYSMKDSGVREAPFWVLVGATMPAILIEAGYITSSNDSKYLGKRDYQKSIADGIAKGIDAYFLKN